MTLWSVDPLVGPYPVLIVPGPESPVPSPFLLPDSILRGVPSEFGRILEGHRGVAGGLFWVQGVTEGSGASSTGWKVGVEWGGGGESCVRKEGYVGVWFGGPEPCTAREADSVRCVCVGNTPIEFVGGSKSSVQ